MKRTIVLLAVLVCALGIFIPAAYADCPADTAGDDSLTCSGTTGTTPNTFIPEGTQVTLVVNGGTLNSAGTAALNIPNGGAVIFQGTVNAGDLGIDPANNGTFNSAGTFNGIGAFISGDGSVVPLGAGTATLDLSGLALAGNRTLDLAGGGATFDLSGLALAGNRTLDLAGGGATLDLSGLALAGNGTFNLAGGGVQLAVILGGDTATLNPDSFTVIDGNVYVGEGDDMVRIDTYAVVYIGDRTVPGVGSIRDGRINARDLAAPDALYCTVEQGISVWAINLEGQGTFSFAVTKQQINAAFDTAVSSGVNQVIGSDSLGNQLYALSDGHTLTFISPDLREAGKTYQTTIARDTCG